MNGQSVVIAARSAIGYNTKYGLGAGGRQWHKDWPWNPLTHKCDCTGFLAWCFGVDRKTDHPLYKEWNGGWLESTAIVRDAMLPGTGMFDRVLWTSAAPGDVLVWGDKNGHQGHVGIVVEANDGPLSVVHCSTGNFRRTGDAIQETDVNVFVQNNAILARYGGLDL